MIFKDEMDPKITEDTSEETVNYDFQYTKKFHFTNKKGYNIYCVAFN